MRARVFTSCLRRRSSESLVVKLMKANKFNEEKHQPPGESDLCRLGLPETSVALTVR